MKKLRRWIKICFFLFIFIVILYSGIYLYAKVTPKLSIESANSFYFYDKEDALFLGSNNEWIKLDQISDDLIHATISIEDKNFYKHQGFDYFRILKAMMINIRSSSKREGASTITQQYAKNLFLDFSKTWKRKLEEAWLTIRLESHYSKDDILEGYLNTINYGGVFGIENASKYYFHKSAKDLSLAESSILAGIPKHPSLYSPLVSEKDAKKRQEIILSSMVRNGYIKEIDKEKALKENLTYYGSFEQNNLKTINYYKDAALEELKSLGSIPDSFLSTGGLKIYTNLDVNAQTILENSIHETISSDSEIEVSSIALEPTSGKIIALVGGKDYSKSQYNRAVSSERQVGSTLKPFLYYSALENGFTASTTFKSTKTTFSLGNGKLYSPENYGKKYGNKEISMAAALSYSDNVFAVKTHLFLGEENLVDIAKRVGISDSFSALPSLALGTKELRLLDMMQGYQVLANEGVKIKPHLIRKVTNADGDILYEYKKEEESVLNKSITFILNDMLANCSSKNMVDYTVPTCLSIAPFLSKTYAIKTGTTDTDHLIFGFNKDIALGVWSGYDDNRKTESMDSTNTKTIWANSIEKILEKKKDHWYETPSNVTGVLVNPITGKAATNEDKNKEILYYIKGTEPYNEDTVLDDLIPTVKEE